MKFEIKHNNSIYSIDFKIGRSGSVDLVKSILTIKINGSGDFYLCTQRTCTGNTIDWDSFDFHIYPEEVMETCEKIIKNRAFL